MEEKIKKGGGRNRLQKSHLSERLYPDGLTVLKIRIIILSCYSILSLYRVFFTGPPSVRLHRGSHQKCSMCQNFQGVWQIVIFKAVMSKKNTLYIHQFPCLSIFI